MTERELIQGEHCPTPDSPKDEYNSPNNGHVDAPTGYYYARFGTCMLTVGCDTPPKEQIVERLTVALEKDSRVSKLKDTTFRPEWIRRGRAFPYRGYQHHNSLLDGSDYFHTIHLFDPFIFTIIVPKKNQPKFRGYDDFPTDTYSVAWDGTTLIALWGRAAEETLPTRAGGQVAIDVLQDVVKAAGFDLYVQACNPACTNLFAHRVIRLTQRDGSGYMCGVQSRGHPCVDATVHVEGGPEDVVCELATEMRYEAENFARFKNLGRRVLDFEDYARELVDKLLDLNYQRMVIEELSVLRSLSIRWKRRGDRKEAKKIIATLWLTLARVEATKRDWMQVRRRFHESTDKRGTSDLYEIDLGEDDTAIAKQDLTFVRAAIEQYETRIDARTVALATAIGAVGAVVGAIAGAGLS